MFLWGERTLPAKASIGVDAYGAVAVCCIESSVGPEFEVRGAVIFLDPFYYPGFAVGGFTDY